jgi:RNA polymerase sigma-70 factor, ECF subfamily
MMTNEASLFETSGGDYALLVNTYYTALYRFALSLAKSSSDAGDLTQQTFFIWSTKGQALRDKSKAKAWLFTTLYRQFLHSRRKTKRLVAFDDLPPGEQEIPETPAEGVDELDAKLVLEALQEVDQVFREPLTLFYLQNRSYLEIAEVLHVPVGTVTSRLSRGKAQLRTCFAQKLKATESGLIPFPQVARKSAGTLANVGPSRHNGFLPAA